MGPYERKDVKTARTLLTRLAVAMADGDDDVRDWRSIAEQARLLSHVLTRVSNVVPSRKTEVV